MNTLSKALKKNGNKEIGQAIVSNFEKMGFGVYSKADFEAYIFHQLSVNIDPNMVKDNYDWMRLLKITPTKLRSLQMIRSAKFLDLDLNNEYNWKLICNALDSRKLETEDKENGKVKIYIDDLHVHRLIERFIVEGGSSVDYTLNRNQLVLKYTEFLNLLDNILRAAKKEPLINGINEDSSKLKIDKEFDKLESVFKELMDNVKDQSYKKIAEESIRTIVKITRKKLGI